MRSIYRYILVIIEDVMFADIFLKYIRTCKSIQANANYFLYVRMKYNFDIFNPIACLIKPHLGKDKKDIRFFQRTINYEYVKEYKPSFVVFILTVICCMTIKL